jgi:hypothetical protein
VRAEKQAGQWVFHDRSYWESRWHALPATTERVAQVKAMVGGTHVEAPNSEYKLWVRASNEAG